MSGDYDRGYQNAVRCRGPIESLLEYAFLECHRLRAHVVLVIPTSVEGSLEVVLKHSLTTAWKQVAELYCALL